MFSKYIHKRIKIVLLVIIFCFILIIGKVFYIQVIDYGKLNTYANGLWSRNLPIESDRGRIMTIDQKVIADNFIKSSEKVLNDDSIIQKIYNLLSVKDLVDKECAVIAEENKKTQVFETKIKDCDAQIKEYENKKISILKDAKICPVCAQIIPDDFGGHIHE